MIISKEMPTLKELKEEAISKNRELHKNEKFYIVGPTYFKERPSSNVSEKIPFPNTYYIVYRGLDHLSPALSKSYFCSKYDRAKSLCIEMNEWLGLDVVEIINSYNEDSNETFESFNDTWAQDEEGLSDDFINDVLDGIPSAYWNLD